MERQPPSQSTLDSLVISEHNECLMCGPANSSGFRLRFRVISDGSVIAMFPCGDALRSYPETLHGGVISSLLDAAMTNALFAIGVTAVTAELTVRFIAPVRLNRGAVISARIEKDADPLFYMQAAIEQDGKVLVRGTAKFLSKDWATGT